MKQRQRRGFTLIELLVVILILGILAALILPKVVGRTDDAKVGAAKTDISGLSSAIETFKLDTGRYPTTEEGLEALRSAPADVNNWKGPYVQKPIPPDPWGYDYDYQYPGEEGDNSFLILSYGADGVPGGDGNNADISNVE